MIFGALPNKQSAGPWLRRIGAALAPLLLALVLWEFVSILVIRLREVPFPTPWTTLERLGQLLMGDALVDHSIYRHIADSLVRWSAGFSVAAVAGTAFGLAVGWWRTLEKLTMTIIYFLQLIPGLAWLPVAILLFGIGETATFFIIAVTAFTPIAIQVSGGVKRVDEMYVRAAKMMGAGSGAVFYRVLLPGAFPYILGGLRVGLGNGWRVLVAAEMIVGAGTGLGYSIIQSRWTLDYSGAFACITVICLVGLIVEKAVFGPLERITVDLWGMPRT